MRISKKEFVRLLTIHNSIFVDSVHSIEASRLDAAIYDMKPDTWGIVEQRTATGNDRCLRFSNGSRLYLEPHSSYEKYEVEGRAILVYHRKSRDNETMIDNAVIYMLA